jgi:hypothetical protein
MQITIFNPKTLVQVTFSIVFSALMLHTKPVLAAPELNDLVHHEALSLLDTVSQSECQFSRNGNWYTAKQGAHHLKTKLKYIESKMYLQNTEQFIEYGATNSSFSGQPYWVKCGTQTPIKSGEWLMEQLQEMRSQPENAFERPSTKLSQKTRIYVM